MYESRAISYHSAAAAARLDHCTETVINDVLKTALVAAAAAAGGWPGHAVTDERSMHAVLVCLRLTIEPCNGNAIKCPLGYTIYKKVCNIGLLLRPMRRSYNYGSETIIHFIF